MKIRCTNCNWHGRSDELLCDDPVSDKDGCPRCLETGYLHRVRSPAPHPAPEVVISRKSHHQ